MGRRILHLEGHQPCFPRLRPKAISFKTRWLCRRLNQLSTSSTTMRTLDSLKDLIETLEIAVKTFAAANRFLVAYDTTHPGCLVLDLKSPESAGSIYTACSAVRNRLAGDILDRLRRCADCGRPMNGRGRIPGKALQGERLARAYSPSSGTRLRKRAERADIIAAKEDSSRLTARSGGLAICRPRMVVEQGDCPSTEYCTQDGRSSSRQDHGKNRSPECRGIGLAVCMTVNLN